MAVTYEAKEWITAHTLKRQGASQGSLRPFGGFLDRTTLFNEIQARK